MTGVGVIAIATVRECTRRRVFGVIVVLTALFLALYLPYGVHEIAHGFENVRGLLGLAASR